jgi:predicted Zn-dependent protease with MMP-like domain
MAMSEQDMLEPEDDSPGDVYDYAREPEPDERTLRSNEQRSRYFLAAMSFLLALLCLSALLNTIPWLNVTLMQLGVVAFAATGVFFLLRRGPAAQRGPDSLLERNKGYPGEDEHQDELTPFELLVQEALATIPSEFQERMENMFVRVVYEPGIEVLRRVGTKEGYTLLGLYEGVPLTAYGRQYSAHPETITIYQRTIERYCHGDPDRIREQVRRTVLHEVAHHFGIDHDEMPIWIR